MYVLLLFLKGFCFALSTDLNSITPVCVSTRRETSSDLYFCCVLHLNLSVLFCVCVWFFVCLFLKINLPLLVSLNHLMLFHKVCLIIIWASVLCIQDCYCMQVRF